MIERVEFVDRISFLGFRLMVNLNSGLLKF